MEENRCWKFKKKLFVHLLWGQGVVSDMDTLNTGYIDSLNSLKTADNALDIEKAMKRITNLRNAISNKHPEYMDSITDLDYSLACGAYRINNVKLLEETVQKHYYHDYRFKKLYQLYIEMETANVWNNIVRSNANNLEKTFVRSLGIIIITGVCLSIILRK